MKLPARFLFEHFVFRGFIYEHDVAIFEMFSVKWGICHHNRIAIVNDQRDYAESDTIFKRLTLHVHFP
jgi:hypothetical protein